MGEKQISIGLTDQEIRMLLEMMEMVPVRGVASMQAALRLAEKLRLHLLREEQENDDQRG